MLGSKRSSDQENTVSDAGVPSRRRGHGLMRTLVALLLIAGVGVGAGWFIRSGLDLHKAEVKATGHVEYTRKFDNNLADMLVCTSDRAEFVVAGDVDATRVGMQSLPVKITEDSFSKEATVQIQVKDTQPPSITLVSSTPTIALGDEVKPSDVVKSVSDPVDGDLGVVETEPEAHGSKVGEEVFYENGWYHVDGLDVASKAGSHKIVVVACDRHGNRASEELELKVEDPLKGVKLEQKTDVLEYSKKPVDPVTLVTCSDPAAKVVADQLDLSTVGKKDVKFKLTKDKSTHEQTLSFTVRDTKNPAIELAEAAVAIDKGSSFDPYANVKSVTDEVDGDLRRVDAKPDKPGDGWFTVQGTYDVNKAGKYSLNVVASDRNGNQVEKRFELEVKEPPAPAPAVTPVPAPAPDPEPAPADEEPAAADTAVDEGAQSDVGDYVLNTNTHKFHYPTCNHVRRIKDENREDVCMSRNEIVAEGYVPCAHCRP